MSQLSRTEQAALKPVVESGDLASLDVDACVVALNERNIAAFRPLTSRECLAWVAEDSHLSKLNAGAAHENTDVANACRVAILLLTHPTAELDLASALVQSRIAVIRAAGVLDAEFASLEALAATSISLIEQMFGRGRTVDNQDVYIARVEIQ